MSIGQNIGIRFAVCDDATAISSLLRDAFIEFEPLYTPAAFRATTPTPEDVARRLDEGPVWIAEVETKIVGTVAAVVRPNGLYIRGMGVAPSQRGMGIARRLLRHVEAFAAGRGEGRLYLSTTPFLVAAIQLYESEAFQRTDEPPHSLHGTPLFTMQKAI